MTPVITSGQNAVLWGAALKEHERRHARVGVRLTGRGLLADGTEFDLHTLDVSAGGMCIVADVRPSIGQKLVVYLELIGGLQGEIARLTPEGFGMSFRASLRKREQIADQLTWLINREHLGEDGQRRAERITPRRIHYVLRHDETETGAEILDLSRTGAALLCDAQPPIGAWLYVGATRARVVRRLEAGFAVEFARVIPVELFDADVLL